MGLAALYHAHHQSYLEDLPFWLAQAQAAQGSCLELGCGSGRVLLPLLQAGINITGLDNDAGMLAFLRGQAAAQGHPLVELVQADLTAFELTQRFASILLPCNTYSTLSTGQRRQALDCIWRHLQPQGLFATSLPNPKLLVAIQEDGEAEVEETFNHPESGYPVQVSSAWVRTPHQFILAWHYDQLLPDGQVERTTVHTSHYLTPLNDYLRELRAAGFQLLAQYGDFNGHAYQRDSAYLILIAQKSGS